MIFRDEDILSAKEARNMKEKKYLFKDIKFCNMCGQKSVNGRVLGQRLNQSQGKRPKRKNGISTSVIKCNNCKLIYSNPQPIPLDIQDHYGVPPESYWKKEYFKVNKNYFLEEIKEAKKLIDFSSGMKALDIGAGIGKCMIALKNAEFDAHGLEPSKPFRERAISVMNISPNKLKLGMLEEVEYPSNEFDFITFGAVLEHLYDPSESILKAFRWLKPNGVLHMEVPSSDYLIAKIINIYYRLLGTNYVTNISPMHEPFHLYEFSLKSFLEHSKQNNYKIASYRYYVCPIYFLPKVTHPALKWYMTKTNTGMQLSIWLKNLNR